MLVARKRSGWGLGPERIDAPRPTPPSRVLPVPTSRHPPTVTGCGRTSGPPSRPPDGRGHNRQKSARSRWPASLSANGARAGIGSAIGWAMTIGPPDTSNTSDPSGPEATSAGPVAIR